MKLDSFQRLVFISLLCFGSVWFCCQLEVNVRTDLPVSLFNSCDISQVLKRSSFQIVVACTFVNRRGSIAAQFQGVRVFSFCKIHQSAYIFPHANVLSFCSITDLKIQRGALPSSQRIYYGKGIFQVKHQILIANIILDLFCVCVCVLVYVVYMNANLWG